MHIEQARFNMIEQQIRTWNVLDQEILDLLTIVKREHFAPAAYKSLAFVDTEIPLVDGECMFPPKTEARILQEVKLKGHEFVLEIGAGSGHMAALLAHKARHVVTIEQNPAIKKMAEQNLARNRITNVDVELGNGAQGWPVETNPSPLYDVIVISGALPQLSPNFLKQLNIGGRIAAIIGEAPVMTAQIITRIDETTYDVTKLFETCVTPLRHIEGLSHFKF